MISKEFFIERRRYSVFSGESPDKNTYPLFYRAKKIEVILNEGQYLFIPAGWFHYVFSEPLNNEPLNIALSHFIKTEKGCAICEPNEHEDYNLSCPKLDDEYIDLNLFNKCRKESQPFISENFKKQNDWTCFSWDKEYLLDKYKDQLMTVNSSVSPMFVSNALTDIYPNNWIQSQMTFKNFMDTNGYANGLYYYLLQTNFNFLDKLKDDIRLPPIIQNSKEETYAIWINFSNVYSGLHFDNSDNILLQIRGRKRILLFPPSERKYLYTATPYSNYSICKMVNR